MSDLDLIRHPNEVDNPSEKYEFVSWDDEFPNLCKNKIHVPNHQPVMVYNKTSISMSFPFIVELPIKNGAFP